MRAATIRITGAIVLLVVVLTGCAPRGARVTFHDPNMDFSLVERVAVLPLGNLTKDRRAADRVRDVFMTMLQATGAVYVLPPGEASRGLSRESITDPATPTTEEIVKLAKALRADAVITGTVREYGPVRSGNISANTISVRLAMMEAQTGKVVWQASSTKGGITAANRLFGGGGKPMDAVTQEAVEELIDRLFAH